MVGSSGMGKNDEDVAFVDDGEAAGLLLRQTGQRATEVEQYETTSRELSERQNQKEGKLKLEVDQDDAFDYEPKEQQQKPEKLSEKRAEVELRE